MMEKLQHHLKNGDDVVIVSASLSLYLAPWCQEHKVKLICSHAAIRNGKLTGRYKGEDCGKGVKARLVQQEYNLKNYNTIYAYGDTDEDWELLNLAHVKYMCGKQVDDATTSH